MSERRGTSERISPTGDSNGVVLESRRPLTFCGWLFGISVLLLAAHGANTRHSAPVIPLVHASIAARYHGESSQSLAVIVLDESDCIEYLWFARQLRLRRTDLGLAAPLVLLLTEHPWQSPRARTAERLVREGGFDVMVASSRTMPWMPRQVAPALLVLGAARRVRAAFPLPRSPNEMYAIIRAVRQLAPARSEVERSNARAGEE